MVTVGRATVPTLDMTHCIPLTRISFYDAVTEMFTVIIIFNELSNEALVTTY